MIFIHFEGTNIPAENNGTPINPPSYWGDDLLDGIAQAFANGSYTVVPEPLPQQPDWANFNLAIFSNAEWQSWSIPQDLRTAIIVGAVGRLPEQLQSAYDNAKFVQPPSPQAVAAWQTIASDFYIPLTF